MSGDSFRSGVRVRVATEGVVLPPHILHGTEETAVIKPRLTLLPYSTVRIMHEKSFGSLIASFSTVSKSPEQL